MKNPLQSLIDLFRHPSADHIAKRQLEEAQRQILTHKDAAEYHDAMVIYLETKIERLRMREDEAAESGAVRTAIDRIVHGNFNTPAPTA